MDFKLSTISSLQNFLFKVNKVVALFETEGTRRQSTTCLFALLWSNIKSGYFIEFPSEEDDLYSEWKTYEMFIMFFQ